LNMLQARGELGRRITMTVSHGHFLNLIV